jgi:hypothetical protein
VVTYAVAISVTMAIVHAPVTGVHVVLVALLVAASVVRAPRLLWQGLLCGMAALMFADLSAFSAYAMRSTHVLGPIEADRAILGGGLATQWFQDHVLQSPVRIPLTLIFIPTYLSLWVVPLPVALWFWLRHPERFGTFAGAFLLLECLGLLVYLAYPETPPWLAAQQGLLPPVDRVVVGWLGALDGFGSWYASSDPAPLEAMPAMHVAVPMLVTMSIIAVHHRKRPLVWLLLLYPATVAVGVIYLGEHYVIDVLAAIALALASFGVAELLGRFWPRAVAAGPPAL